MRGNARKRKCLFFFHVLMFFLCVYLYFSYHLSSGLSLTMRSIHVSFSAGKTSLSQARKSPSLRAQKCFPLSTVRRRPHQRG